MGRYWWWEGQASRDREDGDQRKGGVGEYPIYIPPRKGNIFFIEWIFSEGERDFSVQDLGYSEHNPEQTRAGDQRSD